MKKSFLLTLLGIIVAGATFAQSEETRSLSSFNRISAHEGIDVYIKQGNTEEARVVVDDIELDRVLTEVSGGRLKIHIDSDNKWGRRNNYDVDVYVTYKSLEALSASSAASIESEGTIQASGDFDVDVSSAGEIRAKIVGIDELEVEASSAGDTKLEVTAKRVEASVSSAGSIDIRGKADSQDIEASSSGDYEGYDLESKEAEASASSGGSVEVNVTERIRGRASSGGSVRYRGEPTYVDANSSSGGSVRKS